MPALVSLRRLTGCDVEEAQDSGLGLDDAGLAFALVICAGLATAVGASAVFFKRLVRLASKPVLAAGLGFSGGVMLYVSFVEIFVKSHGAFLDHGMSEQDAYYCTTLCFFCGMALLRLVAMVVHLIDKDHHCCDSTDDGPQIRHNVMGASDIPPEGTPPGGSVASEEGMNLKDHNNPIEESPTIDVDIKPADDVAKSANEGQQNEAEKKDASCGQPGSAAQDACGGEVVPVPWAGSSDANKRSGDKQLQEMGLNTALAIALHNFPEGLATFVATLADPTVGATLAVAIAIHNIPEGLCVALPIYYATGSRIKGFMWALFSGLSEPVGALIGYGIVKASGEDMNQIVYGVLFGVVAGMMVMIVLLELLPTGYRYDPTDKCVTNSLVCGMLVMALSLVLFMV